MPWAETSGYSPACSGVRLQRGRSAAGCPLQSRPLHRGPAVSSLPPAVGNFPPPLGLLRKLLSLSPQVIFHHVALKSWALLGEGGMGPINPLLPMGRGGWETSLMGTRGQPIPRWHLSTWWLNISLRGGSEISDSRAVRVTSCFLQCMRWESTKLLAGANKCVNLLLYVEQPLAVTRCRREWANVPAASVTGLWPPELHLSLWEQIGP